MSQSAKILETVVLVLDQTNTLSFAAAVDPLRAANRQAGRRLFRWSFASPTQTPVRLTSGIPIPAEPLHRISKCDLLIIVAGFNLESQATPGLLAGLRRLVSPQTRVAGIDGGPWIMAHSGMLDGHRATTHWEDLDAFAQRFPQIHAVNSRFEISGPRLTCAGASPALDMMLYLIRQHCGAEVSDKVAAGFIHDVPFHPALPQRRVALNLGGKSNVVSRAHDIMEASLESPVSVADIADQLDVSLRKLQQHFQQALGRTAQSHYLALRLSEAQRLVQNTQHPIQEIALMTGFASQSSFARAFKNTFGCSARDKRRAQ